MSVKIRLKRFGSLNRAHWRIVVADAKMPRDGRFIEEIGYYDPLPREEKIQIKEDRLQYWVKQGAQMSDSLKSLIKRARRKARQKSAK